MSDLISRQAAIERIVSIRPSTPKQSDYSHGVDVGMAMAMVAIKEQPSAEPERKTGIWLLSDIQNKEDNENGNYAYICSNCFHHDIHAKTAVVPYCWFCGAKMERGEKNEHID